MRCVVVVIVGLFLLSCSPFRAWADATTCVVRVEGDPTGDIHNFHDTPAGLLLRAENGWFRYDGTRIVRVEGGPTGYTQEFHKTPVGLLMSTENGLFRLQVQAAPISARLTDMSGSQWAMIWTISPSRWTRPRTPSMPADRMMRRCFS